MTAIGALRARLVLERPEDVADGHGGAVRSWVAVAELWARIEDAGGAELHARDGLRWQADTRITLRHRSDVTPAMRLRRGDAAFDIVHAADPDGRRRRLVCLCRREAP